MRTIMRRARALGTGVALLLLGSHPLAAETLRLGGTGSSLGLLQRLGAAYSLQHPTVEVVVLPSLGSGGGIAAARERAIDLAVSARALRQDELGQLAGVAWLRTPVALVSSHPGANGLTRAGLAALIADPNARWDDGTTLRPVLRQPTEILTTLMLTEFPGMQTALETLRARPEIPVAGTDQDNVEIAVALPGSVTLVPLIQLAAEQPPLRLLPLDGVEPSVETLRDGRYPLSLTLTLVTHREPTPMGAAFAAFLTSPAGRQLVRGAGGLPLDPR